MKKALVLFATSALLALTPMSAAKAETFVIVNLVTEEGVGPDIGRVVVTETPHGVVFTPDLERLPPGMRGSTQAVLAPRLKLADLKGRSVMVHAGGDNFSDEPSKLGGGGSRIACGIVKES